MAAPSDWVTTTRQALPRFLELASKLKPTHHLPDIRAIDEVFLDGHQVEALLWDVDGTLMSHHNTCVAEELQSTMEVIARRTQVRQAVLSNCGETRFAELGRIFPQIPVMKAYRTPAGSTILRTLQGGRELWSDGREGARDLAAEGLVPVKKPSGELIELALESLGKPERDRVFMVGDQYFTDIAGANLAGIRSVKVPTLERGSFPFAVRSFQRIESLLYRLLNGAT